MTQTIMRPIPTNSNHLPFFCDFSDDSETQASAIMEDATRDDSASNNINNVPGTPGGQNNVAGESGEEQLHAGR